MTKLDHNSRATTSGELRKWSQHFVNEFLKTTELYPSLVVNLSFYPTQAVYQTERKRSCLGPVHSEKQGNYLTIHLCEEGLKDIPLLALQGWLDQELTCYLLKLQSELYRFNFSKQILSRFPVSGSAVNLIRHVIEHLGLGLKRYIMTTMIIDLGHGFPQVYFYFFNINPSLEEKENYQRIIPHNWIRALFLCEKLKEFMSISLLADRNIGFSRDLKSYWWNYNEYLLLEDRSLLEKLSAIPNQYIKESFSYKLVEMFRKVQSHLFSRRSQKTVSDTLH